MFLAWVFPEGGGATGARRSARPGSCGPAGARSSSRRSRASGSKVRTRRRSRCRRSSTRRRSATCSTRGTASSRCSASCCSCSRSRSCAIAAPPPAAAGVVVGRCACSSASAWRRRRCSPATRPPVSTRPSRWCPQTLHVLAMACWLGGLVMLVAIVLVRPLPDGLRHRGQPVLRARARIASRVLLVTGGFQTWRQVDSLAALKDTDFGRLLLAKLVVFAAMVVAAAFSREVVNRHFRDGAYADDRRRRRARRARRHAGRPVRVPALVGAAGGDAARHSRRARRPRRVTPTPTVEPTDEEEARRCAARCGSRSSSRWSILAITAMLVNTAPARSVSTEPVSLSMRSGSVFADGDDRARLRRPQRHPPHRALHGGRADRGHADAAHPPRRQARAVRRPAAHARARATTSRRSSTSRSRATGRWCCGCGAAPTDEVVLTQNFSLVDG